MSIVLFLFFLRAQCRSQQWISFQDDKDFIQRGLAGGLRIGDSMPDLPLGEIINNNTRKSNFKDFRGKLLILDFWNTDCTDCIAQFPYMEYLQKEFKDSIQIILVNKWETLEDIQKKIGFGNKDNLKGNNISLYIPELPIIVRKPNFGRPVLDSLFPTRMQPHHVWIDPGGIIQVRGGHENTYPDKIRKLLSGQKVYNNNDLNTTIFLRPGNEPYWKIMGYMKNVLPEMGSIVTKFNNEYFSSGGGGFIKNVIDSGSSRRRSTYINKEILELYKFGIYERLIADWNKQVIYKADQNDFGAYGYFILSVKDTLRYTSKFRNAKDVYSKSHTLKDTDIIKSRFCYEQILPATVSDSCQTRLMKQDLDKYFFNLYGTRIFIEQREIPCFILIKDNGVQKNSRLFEKETGIAARKIYTDRNNQVFENTSLKSFINIIINNSETLSAFFSNNRREQKAFMILNETGWDLDRKIIEKISVHNNLASLQDLKVELRKYNLDIIEGIRKKEVIIVKDN